MGFVEDDQVPIGHSELCGLRRSELVRRDDDAIFGLEGSSLALLQPLAIILRFEDQGPKAEFLEQLLRPLLTKGRRDDQKYSALSFGPALRDDEAGLDGLPEPHLVGENRSPRDRRLQCEQRCIDLMRVHLDARSRKRLGERVLAHTFERDPMGKKLTLG